MTDLFTRSGSPAKAHGTNEKGRPYIVCQSSCTRCGGAGGADKWKFTGWTCYECGGNGKGKTYTAPLYTAEQLEKLNATKARRDAKAQAKREALAAQRAAETESRREQFMAEHGALLERMARHGSVPFISDVRYRALFNCEISLAQIEAVTREMDKIETEAARKARADYVGQVGERIVVEGTVKFLSSYDGAFGTVWVTGIVDAAGNLLVYKGQSFGDSAVRGQPIKLKATVKQHTEYRGEKQTILSRPSLL